MRIWPEEVKDGREQARSASNRDPNHNLFVLVSTLLGASL